MPQWAHLPLILKPDGNGKLSKRDGDRLGFPVFAMNWTDPKTGEETTGFYERGFMPEAFINMLAMLGWNDGTEQELFSLDELAKKFSMERVHHAGAKFDFEKAKWFNHEWIKRSSDVLIAQRLVKLYPTEYQQLDQSYLQQVIGLIKDRCTFLSDFWQQGSFFFKAPVDIDIAAIQPKWSAEKSDFFTTFKEKILSSESWAAADIETSFKNLALEKNIKPGELQLPLRVMLVGGKFGPGVFDIAAVIGKEETGNRINYALKLLEK